MNRFDGKRILLAITGGIAAYKACDVIRALQKEGATVTALMTPSAQAFIGEVTLECLTQGKVYVDNLENTPEGIPTHIALAQNHDALVMVPASANTLAKLAHGLGDNLLTTTALTFSDKPIVIAPAMNTRMWNNALVQANIDTLQRLDNITFISPTVGDLACGEFGDGKLADIETIVFGVYHALHPHRNLYQGQSVVVTAGGTIEPIDPVRTLSNRSSGKMGVALADELYAMGATVQLIHTLGEPLQRPYLTSKVQTVTEMKEAVETAFQQATGLVMAAAVSDFKVLHPSEQKIKKQETLTLQLEKAPDILATVAHRKRPGQWVVGFAAESHDMETYAQEKLSAKNLDCLVANDISREDIGFGATENEVHLYRPNQAPILLEKATKRVIAQQILLHVASQVVQTTPAAWAFMS